MREFKAERVPRPPTLRDLTDLPVPLDLEIGAGQGLHAVSYCRAHPERRLLAVERTLVKFARLQRRRNNHPELSGLTVLNADAVSVVTHALAPHSLERVFLLYPNPYPKAKQANLRWHNSPFMAELKRKMRPGADLHLATNLEWYAEEACEKLTHIWGFRLQHRHLLGPDSPPRTHFEKKYLERGETCFDLLFQL